MQVTLGLAAPFFHGRVQPELSYLPQPPANDGFEIEIDTNYSERPICLAFELTTEAGGGNRQIILQLLTPRRKVLAQMPVASAQAGGLTYTYSFQAQLTSPSAVSEDVVISPLFSWIIPSTYIIGVGLVGGSADDQIANVVYYRDRFSTGRDGYWMGGIDESRQEDVVAARAALIQ